MANKEQKEFIKEAFKRVKKKHKIEELNKKFNLVDWQKEEYIIPKGYKNIDVGTDYQNSLYWYLRGITSSGKYY